MDFKTIMMYHIQTNFCCYIISLIMLNGLTLYLYRDTSFKSLFHYLPKFLFFLDIVVGELTMVALHQQYYIVFLEGFFIISALFGENVAAEKQL